MFLLSSAMSLIDSYDVVSFDIFDTLLVRQYVKPIDLFIHLERLHGAEGFAKHRVQAELNARKRRSGQEDVNIDQIYEEVCEEFKGFQPLEIEFEAQLLRANKGVKELYDYAIEQGKTVVIASDMYLGAEIMNPILAKCGYSSHHKLYMSCDLDRTKHTGRLYEYILADLGVEASAMLHFGDNKHSDVKMANALGIRGFYIPKVMDVLFANNLRAKRLYEKMPESLGVSTMLGLLAQCDIDQRDDYWRHFGFVYGGPVIYSFVRWILSETERDGIKDILCVARDGYIIERVGRIIASSDDATLHYLYAPRFINHICNIDYDRNKIDHIRTILDYYKDRDDYLRANTPDSTDLWVCGNFLESNIDLYKQLAKSAVKEYRDYINSFNLRDSRIAMVDSITVHYSAQKVVEMALPDKVVEGLYWIILTNQFKGDSHSRSFKQSHQSARFNWSIMEFIMSAPEPPIRGLDGLKPLYGEVSEHEQRRLDVYPQIANGMEEFAQLCVDLFGDLDIYIDYEVINLYMSLLSEKSNATKLDKEMFSDIMHATDLGHTDYKPLMYNWYGNISDCAYAYNLFGVIPICHSVKYNYKEKIYLFKYLPIWKIKRQSNSVSHYLFGVIPILKIKRE